MATEQKMFLCTIEESTSNGTREMAIELEQTVKVGVIERVLSPEKWSGKCWSGGPFFHGILVRGDYFSMEKWSGRTKFPWRNGPVMEKWSALHETFLPVAGRPKRVISSQLYNYNRLNRQMLAAGRAFLLTERSLDRRNARENMISNGVNLVDSWRDVL